jgi:DNA-binding transcriptional MerR regulator
MPLDKSPDAFRTISEVADDLDVPQHVLRFWETRFSQIKPLKRGGGRRYYRPDDVDLLRGLKRLLYGEGYTIKGVQRILKERGPRHVIAIARGAPVEAEGADAPVARATAKAPAMRPEPRLDSPTANEAKAGLRAEPVSLEDTPYTDGNRAAAEPRHRPAGEEFGAGARAGLRSVLAELSEARARLVAVASPARTGEDAA